MAGYEDLVDYVNRSRTPAPTLAGPSPTPAPTGAGGGGQYQDLVEYVNRMKGGTPGGGIAPAHSVTPETDQAYNLGQKIAIGTAAAVRIGSGLATIPTEALHLAPGAGTAAKAGIGAAIGFGSDAIAQGIEMAARVRKEFSKTEAGVAAGLMAIPLGEIPRAWKAGAVAYRALQGAGLGAVGTQAVPLLERGEPASLKETAIGAGIGGAFAGGAQKFLGWRQGRKLPPPPIPPPGTEGFVPPAGTIATARVAPSVEPVIKKIGYDYKFDPGDNRWKVVNRDGDPVETLYPEHSDPTKKLVESLNFDRDRQMAGLKPPAAAAAKVIEPVKADEKTAIKEEEKPKGAEPAEAEPKPITFESDEALLARTGAGPKYAEAVTQRRKQVEEAAVNLKEGDIVIPAWAEGERYIVRRTSKAKPGQVELYKEGTDPNKGSFVELTHDDQIITKVVEKLGEAGPAISPYFIEKHGDNYAVFERTTPEGKPSNRIMLTPTTLERAQARKAELDTDLQAVAAAMAQGRNRPPPRDYSGTHASRIANERRAEMYGLIDSPDHPNYEDPSLITRPPVEPEPVKEIAKPPGAEPAPAARTLADVEADIAKLNAQGKLSTPELADERQRLLDQQSEAPGAVPVGQLAIDKQLPEVARLAKPEDMAELDALHLHWSSLNNQLLSHRFKPFSEAALKLSDEQQAINTKMAALKEKLPQGDVGDVGVIGGGPSGLGAAINGPLEGVDVTVHESQLQVGGASRFTSRLENITGGPAMGETGKQRAWQNYMKALRTGAQFKRGQEIIKAEYDPATEIWTVKSKGKPDSHYRAIIANTGMKFRKLTDKEGNLIPGADLVHIGNADAAMLEAGKGQPVLVLGGSNAAAQAALAAKSEGHPVTVMARNRFSMSDYQVRQLFADPEIIKIEGDQVVSITGERNEMKTVTTKNGRTLQTKAVGGFLGGTARTEWLPDYVMRSDKGEVITNARHQVLDKNGQPVPGLYAAGIIRQDSVNRVLASEGEGQRAITFAGQYIDSLRNTGKLPPWKNREKAFYNRAEWQGEEPVTEARTIQPPTGKGTTQLEPTSQKPLPSAMPTGKSVTLPSSPSTEAPPYSSQAGVEAKGYGKPQVRGYGPSGAEDPAVVAAQAEARVAANPHYTDKLMVDIKSGDKTTLDTADEMLLTHRRGVNQDARDVAGQRAMDTRLNQSERAEAAANFEDLDAQVRMLDEATDGGQILKHRQSRLLWHQFRARDYDLPAMEQKMTIARGGGGAPLTPKETADLKVKTDRLAQAMLNVENAKIRTGWRPGLGANVGPGLRHEQHLLQEAKDALDDIIFRETMISKGKINRAIAFGGDVTSLARSAMTAADLSAVRRQGGLFFMSHPLRSIRLMGDMMRAAKSPEAYFTLMQDIRERPNAELYLTSKLGLTEIKSPKLSQLEEMYGSRWADKIPVINHSQRAYVYFLNRLRADSFDTMAANLGRNGQVTAQQARELSNFINVWTGRGRIPEEYAQAAVALNQAFFAPRYVISRFQALTLQPLRYAKDPAVRKLIAAEYGRTLIGYGVLFGLIKAAGYDIEIDPRSTDFGKLIIKGRTQTTRVDFLSGMAQPTVFLSRLITGQTKTQTGRVEKLYGTQQFSQRNLDNVILDFFRSKLAPMPAAVWNVRKGKRVTGEETTVGKEFLGLVTPLSGRDIFKVMREHNVPTGVALSLMAFFGESVNTYAARGKPARKPHPHK